MLPPAAAAYCGYCAGINTSGSLASPSPPHRYCSAAATAATPPAPVLPSSSPPPPPLLPISTCPCPVDRIEQGVFKQEDKMLGVGGGKEQGPEARWQPRGGSRGQRGE